MESESNNINFLRNNLLYLDNHRNVNDVIKDNEKNKDSVNKKRTLDNNLSNEENKRIKVVKKLITPEEIKSTYPIDNNIQNKVIENRKSIENIISGKSKKKIIICGPCSIHNARQALEYANFVREQRDKYGSKLEIIMRVYVTKPRTNVGWKGYVYDPHLYGLNHIELGLKLSRRVMIEICKLGIPCSMEHVDTIIPQYFDDLVCWAAIGARTTESQIHRELSSGVSTPIGFKNGTNGDVDISINAIISSYNKHNFIGCNYKGNICSFETKGNPFCHIILRGSKNGTNYDEKSVNSVIKKCQEKNINNSLLIDCSHGNCEKQFEKQKIVALDVLEQMKTNPKIGGIMLESNLKEGKQNLHKNRNILYDVSITDGCLDLFDTEQLIKKYFSEL